MPTVQRIQTIVFLGRWLTIRAPTVPKRPKAMPVLMTLAYLDRFFPSRIPITVAARIKDTQRSQTTQATRCPVPGPGNFLATLYEECICLLLIESMGQAFIYFCLRILPYYSMIVSQSLRKVLRSARLLECL